MSSLAMSKLQTINYTAIDHNHMYIQHLLLLLLVTVIVTVVVLVIVYIAIVLSCKTLTMFVVQPQDLY